jgi:hypothetical protein
MKADSTKLARIAGVLRITEPLCVRSYAPGSTYGQIDGVLIHEPRDFNE